MAKDLVEGMLVALAAAKVNPKFRLKRNEPRIGRDILVQVDAATGDFTDKGTVNPDDPRTWPCVIMLFGSDVAGAKRCIKKGEHPATVPTVCSRFYAHDPFNPIPTNRLTCVGDDIAPGTALVKVAERS